MKYIAAALVLIIWMILSLALVCTFIGFFVIVDTDSGWCNIPAKLLSVFETKE